MGSHWVCCCCPSFTSLTEKNETEKILAPKINLFHIPHNKHAQIPHLFCLSVNFHCVYNLCCLPIPLMVYCSTMTQTSYEHWRNNEMNSLWLSIASDYIYFKCRSLVFFSGTILIFGGKKDCPAYQLRERERDRCRPPVESRRISRRKQMTDWNNWQTTFSLCGSTK